MATDLVPIPDWSWWENAGIGVAVGDVDGDGRPGLVVLAVDDPPGPNAGSYRLGRGLDQAGNLTGGWGDWTPIPDWFSWQNADCGLAIADLDGDGRAELIVFMVDAPEGPNASYYRVGWRLDAAGVVTGGWSDWTPIPDWFAWQNQGAGVAVADLDGDGRPELLVFQVDNPPGENGGYYSVGWALDGTGRAGDGWGPWTAVPDWQFWENAGAAVAVADLGGGRPDVLVVAVDNRPGRTRVTTGCLTWPPIWIPRQP